MEQLYLMPGEERYTKFQDENGVPKVRYTYCSLHGRLFNCTCKTMDEAQRLCEDWLVTQDRQEPTIKGQALGGLGLSGLFFFLAVLFLCKEQLHILLRFYDLLHLIPCLSVLWIECFFLGEQSRILRVQLLYLR